MMSLLLIQTQDKWSTAGRPWQHGVHTTLWLSQTPPWERPLPLASGTCALRQTERTAARLARLKKSVCEQVNMYILFHMKIQ